MLKVIFRTIINKPFLKKIDTTFMENIKIIKLINYFFFP